MSNRLNCSPRVQELLCSSVVRDNHACPPLRAEEIVDALGRSNLTDEQIRAILGGNWLRVAGDVWR